MNNINLTEKEFQKLRFLSLPKEVFNAESEIYNFPNNKVFKFLFCMGKEQEDKIYTINWLNEKNELFGNEFVLPRDIINIEGTFSGFTMNKVEGTHLSKFLLDPLVSSEYKVMILKKIGILLEEMSKTRKSQDIKDLYVCDLHEDNILVQKSKDIFVVDTDSMKIEGNTNKVSKYLTPFSFSSEVEKYHKNNNADEPGFIVCDQNTDIFCYSMIILNYLSGMEIGSENLETFVEYLNYLNIKKVNKELVDVFALLMDDDKNNINPFEYLSVLDDDEIARCRIKY